MRDPARFAGLALLVLLAALMARHWPDLGSWSTWFAGAIPLVIAAIAQAQIALAGGQGLSAGAVALLVTALVSAHMQGSAASMAGWSAIGLALGGAIGLANGVLIGCLRLPSTAVTLATSFIVGGTTLAVTGLAPEPSPQASATSSPARPGEGCRCRTCWRWSCWRSLRRSTIRPSAGGWSHVAERRANPSRIEFRARLRADALGVFG
jgi:ribose/xylose/arabinose/galactoside ABC-type transport system permease subunit